MAHRLSIVNSQHSPRQDDEEIHDIPNIPQIRVLVQHQPERQNLQRCLHREDAEEILFRLLQLLGEHGFVAAGQMLFEGEHHAVGDDCAEDGKLERLPVHDVACESVA